MAEAPSNNDGSIVDDGFYRVVPNSSGGGLDPAEAMATKAASQSLSRLTIPEDTPPYYFKLDVQVYERKSWREVAHVSPVVSIILPIPMNVMDAQTVDWEGEDIGLAGATLSNGWSNAEATGSAAFAKNLATRVGGQFAPGAIGGLLSSQGVAINNYLTMMLKGPTYKKHDFSWVISPRNPSETKTLIDVRKTLMDAQSPELYLGSAFFKYPCVFNLSFNHAEADMGETLYRFKPAVLTSCVFNMTPQNTPAFFSKTKAPPIVAARMEFTELEFWLKGDYGSTTFGTGSNGGGGW